MLSLMASSIQVDLRLHPSDRRSTSDTILFVMQYKWQERRVGSMALLVAVQS
jgi:hypothetical protein